MDENDLNNLQFLLNASPEILEDWYNLVSDDCKLYAMTLLIMGTWEILDMHTEIDLAKSVLQRFRIST